MPSNLQRFLRARGDHDVDRELDECSRPSMVLFPGLGKYSLLASAVAMEKSGLVARRYEREAKQSQYDPALRTLTPKQ